ncbi:carcinoembryonic antigen-related cell adhesion molecule 5-like [Acipenser ruthenus]|uniref:carcinoembryonic antigen-related cell adhesion molecule 5-like n=1 Tax=Acipenser ruthenus TaxID=7906 RepID=UPI00274273A8|nr:carcinoembryonic antigen-related cell adhesion molecule 5-like [Acipenser ruthenus]
MENSQAALLTLGFLLFLKGCETLASERSTNLAVGVGEDVQLKINPPVAVFAVTWYFGSTGLLIVTWNSVSETVNPPYQGRVELNKNTGTLTLKNVSRSDSGDYLYQAVSTATGHPVQYNGNISLTVYQPITNVNVKPSLAQPIANQALNLTCEVLGSQTVSSRLWLKDGQPLSTSDRITLSVDSRTVSFNPVLQSDNGKYQCKATNPVNEVTSAAYRLEVNYGPEQVSITGPDQAILNSSVTFTCSAQSLPPCIYTWYFNGTETAQGSQYKIASVSNADSGSYTCVAWNSVTGRNSSAVKKLIVTGLGSLTSGEIAGIVIGTLAGVTGVALGVYFSVKLCRNNPHDLRPGPAQSSPGAATYENFEGPRASATYENTTAIRRAGEAENPDSTYTGLQFPDQSTYSTLNRP